MALLASHLEQISLSSKSIVQLEFPPPKIFTNALLGHHEITTLIRDTESHERALFSINPSAINAPNRSSSIRPPLVESALHGRKSLFPSVQPVRQSAVTRLLGTEMLREIRQSTSNTARSQERVNVEVLLRGAEKLCQVYAVPGVPDKILTLRKRHGEISASLVSVEERVQQQQTLSDRRNKGLIDEETGDGGVPDLDVVSQDTPTFTLEDFQAEEEEIRELEARKKTLEDRISGIERDLGGLR
ncbi:uncharacterized protein A1O9_10130 [Exophiala aquamarina CBS 119918]|uniref:DASH complex subunit SPC34 n=1 Tax=Exophiala aquamarina CBS 119918 TaxID=1182545 RepID=A0A072P0R4_9EURO|nr:uncharacterized protein A1O9_10130 [Exophiala aquamarina CBS 119918]KEF53729.1 hypothetical protein A1O9_10130 [Exophiala aquamarina CBS 119918]